MLARNFKSAADLKITDETYGALIQFLGMAERGEVKHELLDATKMYDPNYGIAEVHYVNMRVWGIDEPGCGTVSCIGGSLEAIMRKEIDSDDSVRMSKLFHPLGGIELELWNRITVPQMAQAIRNFLGAGEPRWEEVLATG